MTNPSPSSGHPGYGHPQRHGQGYGQARGQGQFGPARPPTGHAHAGQPPGPASGVPYGTPQPPPKRRSKLAYWLVGGAALTMLCCGGGLVAVALNDDDGSPSAGPEANAPGGGDTGEAGDAVAGVGDPARDGKFEFVVTEIETGVESVGGDLLGETAQGQFVLVRLTVENIGDEAQYFDGSSQALIDTEGREHSADSAAALFIEGSDSLLNEINPGNQVDGVVVFDIPADAVPATLRLHDSPFSGGVEVNVSQS